MKPHLMLGALLLSCALAFPAAALLAITQPLRPPTRRPCCASLMTLSREATVSNASVPLGHKGPTRHVRHKGPVRFGNQIAAALFQWLKWDGAKLWLIGRSLATAMAERQRRRKPTFVGDR